MGFADQIAEKIAAKPQAMLSEAKSILKDTSLTDRGASQLPDVNNPRKEAAPSKAAEINASGGQPAKELPPVEPAGPSTAAKNPEAWKDSINPGGPQPGRDANCADCALKADAAMRGEAPPSAARDRPEGYQGMASDDIEKNAGGKLKPLGVEGVEQQLQAKGPGASAIVTCQWGDGGGHAFNAVNVGGKIMHLDTQSGEYQPWPPPNAGDMSNVSAIVRDPGKKSPK